MHRIPNKQHHSSANITQYQSTGIPITCENFGVMITYTRS